MSQFADRRLGRKIRRRKDAPESADEPARATLRLAVLISGTGSNLQALIDAIELKRLPAVEIVLVVSNNASAQGLQRALEHHLPLVYLPWEPAGGTRGGAAATEEEMSASEIKLSALLRLFQVDLIVLAGWMRILSAAFLEQFPRQVINLHPALLPDDGRGQIHITRDGTRIPVFRGLHAVRQALQAGVKVTGSSVHYVTPEVDAGPVICRAEVLIEAGDSEESLHERLKNVEHRLIVEAVRIYRELRA
jgi:phosphoribosylglycinamide formyltransferase 1